VLFALWIVITFVVDDGMVHFIYGSMVAVETLGSYLLGRFLIRNADDYRLMIRIYLWVLITLLPFALYEFLTGRILLHEFYAHLGETVWKPTSSHPRWGFQRVMSGFDHPILYGLFCSMLASSIFYVYKHTRGTAVARLGLIGWMTFMSLSSGPLLSLLTQIGLVLWGRITRGRWILLTVLVMTVYVALTLLSHRGPIVILITYLTFNPWTAWTRIVQWTYATVAVMDNPIFGLGLGPKWATVVKPWWLTGSVDSYWLVIAMRHGLVGVGLVGASFVLTLFDVIRVRLPSALLRDYRTGYVIGVIGLCLVLFTVHIWGAVNDFAFFFLGAGAWLVEAGKVSGSAEAAAIPPDGMVRRGDGWATTRFAQDHVRPGKRRSASARPPDAATALTPAAGEYSGKASQDLPRRRRALETSSLRRGKEN